MAYAEWMWSDADVMGAGFGRMNRMVWSSRKSLEDTMLDLRNVSGHNCNRQISLKARWEGITLKQDFENVNSALVGLLAIAEAWAGCKENMAEACTVECALHTYSQLFEDSAKASVTKVRWMWNDAGLSNVVSAYATLAKKNPLRWSEWLNVAGTIEALEAIARGVSESRPVKLEFSATTNMGLLIIMEVRCPSVQEAVVFLLEVVTQQCESGTARACKRRSTSGDRHAGGNTQKSRASSVEEVFFFPLELEQAVEDAQQVLKDAERRLREEMAEKEALEIAQRQQNVELAEMLERTTRQRKVRAEMLAEVARNLQPAVVERFPSTDRGRKRCKSLGEALEAAVERRTIRMRQT